MWPLVYDSTASKYDKLAPVMPEVKAAPIRPSRSPSESPPSLHNVRRAQVAVPHLRPCSLSRYARSFSAPFHEDGMAFLLHDDRYGSPGLAPAGLENC
jgi:hypothetical protein